MAEVTSSDALTDGLSEPLKDPEFSLTADEMQKIEYLGKLERRKNRGRSMRDFKRNTFSDKMSLEAQIAMQLAFRDTQVMKTKGNNGREDETGSRSPIRAKHNHVTFADEPPMRPDTTCSKYSSFSEAFEKMASVRMRYDLTDDNFEPLAVHKRALDGMKVQNTLEMVEIVNAEEPHCPDDEVINQIAQRNAVEKCLVWMEVVRPQEEPATESKKGSSSAESKKQTTPSGKTGSDLPME